MLIMWYHLLQGGPAEIEVASEDSYEIEKQTLNIFLVSWSFHTVVSACLYAQFGHS